MSTSAPQPGAGSGSASQEDEDEESAEEQEEGASEAPSVDSGERREAARIRRTRRRERRQATMYGIRMTDDEWVGEHRSQCIPGISLEEPMSAPSVTEPVNEILDSYIS